jgi:hypothetical protein
MPTSSSANSPGGFVRNQIFVDQKIARVVAKSHRVTRQEVGNNPRDDSVPGRRIGDKRSDLVCDRDDEISQVRSAFLFWLIALSTPLAYPNKVSSIHFHFRYDNTTKNKFEFLLWV